MNDHKLPDYDPDEEIRHLKRLWIFVTAETENGVAVDLKFNIVGHTRADENPGLEVNTPGEAYDLIDEFIAEPFPMTPPIVERTPLDFAIHHKCVIALKLLGGFWAFTDRGSKGSVRTKQNQDRRYYHLRHKWVRGRIALVSFCAEEPEDEDRRVKHGINLYVDFVQPGMRDEVLRLPVIIDPDIENKGGNPTL